MTSFGSGCSLSENRASSSDFSRRRLSGGARGRTWGKDTYQQTPGKKVPCLAGKTEGAQGCQWESYWQIRFYPLLKGCLFIQPWHSFLTALASRPSQEKTCSPRDKEV